LKSNYSNKVGEQVVGDIELVKLTNGQIWVREALGSGSSASSSAELKSYLNSINKDDIPAGIIYVGDLYRSLSIISEVKFRALPKEMTDQNIFSSWGRYDLNGEENALYLSKTLSGNQKELVPHYGEWKDYSTYKFEDVQVDNLLDLTNAAVYKKLAVNKDMLTKIVDLPINPTPNQIEDAKNAMYTFTNEVAEWARRKGYNGLIVYGARDLKDYENVILFDQKYINQILENKPPIKIQK